MNSLTIGTEPGNYDVVENGIVQNLFKMAHWQLGTPHSDMHHHLETNRTRWKLYISTESSSMNSTTASFGLHMGRPVLSVERPDVVYASTSQMFSIANSGRRHRYLYNDRSVVIDQGEELEVSFSLVCRKKGESRIFVSIPMLHYDAVEFGFAKRCDYVPKVRRGISYMSVAISFSLVFSAIIAIAIVIYRIRSTTVDYKGVRMSED